MGVKCEGKLANWNLKYWEWLSGTGNASVGSQIKKVGTKVAKTIKTSAVTNTQFSSEMLTGHSCPRIGKLMKWSLLGFKYLPLLHPFINAVLDHQCD